LTSDGPGLKLLIRDQRVSASFGTGQHLHRQTLWLRSVAGQAGDPPVPHQRAAEKGPARPLRSRTWTTVRIRRRAGRALRLGHLCQGADDHDHVDSSGAHHLQPGWFRHRRGHWPSVSPRGCRPPSARSDVGRLVFFFSGPDDEEPDLLFEAGKHNFGPFPSSATYWLILKSGNENARGAASIDEPPLQDWKFGHRDDRHCSQRACG
jgi:hypothetical protein